MRDYKYKNTTSKDGSFSLKVKDKKLCKELDAICIYTSQNKSKFCISAIQRAVNEELARGRQMTLDEVVREN